MPFQRGLTTCCIYAFASFAFHQVVKYKQRGNLIARHDIFSNMYFCLLGFSTSCMYFYFFNCIMKSAHSLVSTNS